MPSRKISATSSRWSLAGSGLDLKRRLGVRLRQGGGAQAADPVAWAGRFWIVVGLACFVWMAGYGAPVQAREPTREPILRVETGMHTTLIRRLVVDSARNRVISCSDDKTIRVWQLPEQRLVSVLRVPIDQGHEGQLFGLAVSPDGRTVAAGGWTGWDWEGTASVYLFDVASGELTRRIGGFRDAIHALAWSPDGAYLAVGLQGRAGLDVVRVTDGQVVARDPQYRDKLTDLDFDREGRLAAVSLDGMTRLYDKQFKLLGRRVVPGGKQPISVRFSPDASQIAIGFVDVAAVSVVSGKTLDIQFSPATQGMKQQRTIYSVAWSSDGRHLYASGDYRGEGKNPVYRWGQGGRGPLERIAASSHRITEIQQMPGNRMAYAAEDPGFGVIGPTGEVQAFRGPDILDFSGAHGALLVSADGVAIRYPAGKSPAGQRGFSALAGGDQNPRQPPAAKTFPPILQAKGLKVEQWKDSYTPKINGQKPSLDDYELSRSYAIDPEGKHVLLGTEWALRLLDAQAKTRWQVKLAATAWAVNIARDGRLAVAALSDGTVRWYRMRDGREVFAYFQHNNDRDWIAWLPSGYYVSSVYGDNHIGWHLNRSVDQTPDFHRAVQFDRVLYRPDLVAGGFAEAVGKSARAGPDVVAGDEFNAARLQEIAPPRLRILEATVKPGSGREVLVLRLRGEQGAAPTLDVSVFVNRIPMLRVSERKLGRREAERFERTFEIPLSQRQNDIRVEAFNGFSLGVAETYLGLPEDLQIKPVRGDLYVLAIGVNEFPQLPARLNLAYAARDAQEFVKAIEKQGRGYFRKIHTQVVNDFTSDKPTREQIAEALAFIQRAEPTDIVMVFLASHGISDLAGNYYFVPRDARIDDLKRLETGGKIESLMPWTEFFDSLRMAAGKRLLIVDTCQARNIEGRFEAHSLMKRSAASLFSLMLASKGDEESQEYPEAKHGLFTYSLISSMDPGADRNQDGYLSVSEWFKASAPIVERGRDKRVGPQTPQLVAPEPLGDTALIPLNK
ncbi:MAG: caspase family protein [Pseudomonadota bacterium]